MNRVPLLRLLLGSLMALLASLPTAPAFAVENVIHYTIPVHETFTLPLGDVTASCVGYPGTVTGTRDGTVDVTEFIDGPNAGRIRIRGHLVNTVIVQPDDPALGPVYSGHAVLRWNEIVRSDEDVVFSFSRHFTATSSEGNALKFNEHQSWVIKDGDIKVDFFNLACVK